MYSKILVSRRFTFICGLRVGDFIDLKRPSDAITLKKKNLSLSLLIEIIGFNNFEVIELINTIVY